MQETRPSGFHRSYDGVDVYDGAYPYGDTRLVPSWGGSMFEALMPAWRQNHPLIVDAQVHHGLVAAGCPAMGFSPSNVPEGGYAAWGGDRCAGDAAYDAPGGC